MFFFFFGEREVLYVGFTKFSLEFFGDWNGFYSRVLQSGSIRKDYFKLFAILDVISDVKPLNVMS